MTIGVWSVYDKVDHTHAGWCPAHGGHRFRGL